MTRGSRFSTLSIHRTNYGGSHWPVVRMPDSHLAPGPGPGALASGTIAKSRARGAVARTRSSDSRFSLVMVGLMGAPPWFRPNDERGGLLARSRGRVFAPFIGRRALSWFPFGAITQWPANPKAPGRYVSATVLVAAAGGVSWLLQPFLSVGSLVLPFLIAIMLTAIAYGLLPSLLASALGVLTFDFFFLPPLYSLNISEPDDVMRLAVFATAALIVSNLAAYARAQAVTASLR